MKTQYYCLLEDDNNLAKTPVKPQMANDETTTKILENNILELANVATWTNIHIFHQAMKLAFFLIPVKKVAAQITQEAISLAKIKSTEKKAHRKRWFANNRYQDGGGPTSLLMHENQFIQSMIYQEAEKYEKYQEGIATQNHINLIKSQANNNADELFDLLSNLPVKQGDWIIRYLKTLVQISNSISADLITAIACLVCNFQIKDAATLHAFFEAISPNYCSKRKLLLMNKLKNRFPLLKVCKKDGKQTYFYGQEQVNSKWSSLVENFFTKTVPWGTKCGDATQHTTLLIKDKIKKLVNIFTKNYIFEKDHKQMSYLHAIVCPDCFLKLVSDVKFDCPREKLALPIFLAENNASSDDSDLDPSNNKTGPNTDRELQLTQTELEDFAQSSSKYLSKEIERRNNLSIKKVSILLDGQPQAILIDKQEQTIWDLTQNKVVWLTLKESSDIAKIVSWDKEGLLIIGLLELNSKAIKDSWQHKLLGWKKDQIVLPNNNIINLAIKLIEKEDEEEFFIAATYEDLTKEWSLNNLNLSNWWYGTSTRELVAVSILLLVLFSSLLIWIRKTTFISPVEIANNITPIAQPTTEPKRGKVITTLLPTKTNLDPTSELNENKIAFKFNSSDINNLDKIDEVLKLDIPNNVNTLQIFFDINHFSNYKQYVAVIETTEPNVTSVRRQTITKQKNKFLPSISIPLENMLASQEYHLIIKGIDNNGIEKELQRYNFIVAHSNVKANSNP
jgi:hypothetical protein